MREYKACTLHRLHCSTNCSPECYKCTTKVLQMCYKCATNVVDSLQNGYKSATNVADLYYIVLHGDGFYPLIQYLNIFLF